MTPASWVTLAFAAMSSVGYGAPPTGQQMPTDGIRFERANFASVAGVDINAYAYTMRGTWWGIAESSDPGFDPDRGFTELWLHPRLSAIYDLDANSRIYAGLSAGITRDIGENPFGYDDEGAEKFENAYLGYATGSLEDWHLDVSAGRQPFTLGTGMLLTAGAINGSEWGNAASAKRIAWRQTAIARIGRGDFRLQAFWLDPHEVPSAESKTRIAGASLEWSDATNGKAGVAWLHIPRSEYFYPGDLAPLAFIEDGRDGLSAYHAWSELTGLFERVPALSVRAELAIETGDIDRLDGGRDDLEAFAIYVDASYWWQTAPLAPKLTYGYARFSGDDRDTDAYERFDPLFWGNGLDNWWFGANGAYTFLNSNVQFHRVTLDAYASARDVLKIQYVRASAVERNSPIQFGQAVQFEEGSLLPIVGVSDRHLADELLLQYARVITPAIVLSAYVTVSTPQEGLDEVTAAGTEAWTSFGIGISASL